MTETAKTAETAAKTYAVDAKILKAMSGWTSSDKWRPALSRIWISGGALYATDSYRAVRLRIYEPVDLPDGTTIDPETFDRMTARDGLVFLTSDGVRMGKATIPYGEEIERVPDVQSVFDKKGDGKRDGYGFNPDFVADVCKMAKAAGKHARLVIDVSDMMRASVHGLRSGSVDMLVMPVRL